MPKIDFYINKIPDGYTPPDPPIVLAPNMEREQVFAWIYQELYNIHQSKMNYIMKEAAKEQIYYTLLENEYDVFQLFDNIGIFPS